MSIKAVIGAGYGDEGKGLVTNWLAEKDGYVCRYNGGHQAAHRVVTSDKDHIFSSFGSGTFKDAITIIGEECTFDPIAFCYELEILLGKGIAPRIMIHPKCQIVTPMDKIANKTKEYLNNGTCGSGFGAAKKRIEETSYRLSFLDLNFAKLTSLKYDAIQKYYSNEGQKNSKKDWDKLSFLDSGMKLILYKTMGIILDYDFNITTDSFVYEGAQGILLDREYGIFPYVTRSNVISKELNNVDEFYLVTRAYATRHGNGPFNNIPIKLKDDVLETNMTNRFQGEFKTGVLNLLDVKRSINILQANYPGKPIYLVVTCLDHLENYPLIMGGKLETFPTEKEFLNCISLRFNKSINMMFVSHSPYSENIKEYNG